MKQHFLFAALIITLLVPALSFAADYSPLVGIPGVAANADFNTYINSLYAISISIAALLAVIKIIIAGVKWMMTDVVTSKGEAKKDIQGALIGLIIVIAAVLILNVINSDITDVNLTFNAPGSVSSGSTVTAPPTLEMSKVTSFTVPGTATIVKYTTSVDPVQQQLFFNSCPQAPGQLRVTVFGVTRCVAFGSNEYATIQTTCSQSDCSIHCKNDPDFKSHTIDPIVKSIGYCVTSN